VKDSVYIYMNNKYYMPSVSMLRELMGVPASFDLSDFSLELQTEIVGQAVEFKMHKAIAKNIKTHITDFVHSLAQLHKYSFPYYF
jgi:DNA (cytosine-5)-methyltransferase 1